MGIHSDAVTEAMLSWTKCICWEQSGVRPFQLAIIQCCMIHPVDVLQQSRFQWPPQHPLMVMGREPL